MIIATAASVWCSVAVLLWSTNPTVAAWSFQRNGAAAVAVGRRGGQRFYEPNMVVTAISGGERSGTTALSSASSSPEPPQQPWITPALHNSNAVRSLALLIAVGATSLLTKTTTATTTTNTLLSLPSAQIAVAIHLFSFATSFGTNLYTTFVLGLTMIKHLPRQTFGKLQAKLFPKYFALSSLTLVLQLVTLKFVKNVDGSGGLAVRALAVALAMTVANQFVLEPLSTDNMMRRYQLEDAGQTKSDEYTELRKKFGQFHGLSSLCNLIALCAGTVHGYLLAGALA